MFYNWAVRVGCKACSDQRKRLTAWNSEPRCNKKKKKWWRRALLNLCHLKWTGHRDCRARGRIACYGKMVCVQYKKQFLGRSGIKFHAVAAIWEQFLRGASFFFEERVYSLYKHAAKLSNWFWCACDNCCCSEMSWEDLFCIRCQFKAGQREYPLSCAIFGLLHASVARQCVRQPLAKPHVSLVL